MATPKIESAMCILIYRDKSRHSSSVELPEKKNGKQSQTRVSIRSWHKTFMKTGRILQKTRAGDQEYLWKMLNEFEQHFIASPLVQQ